MNADNRLAVYGSLAPGQPNHHQLAGLRGRWLSGVVRGRLVARGWGARLGFPALVLEESGDTIVVQLFESDDLPCHWQRLDAFEGGDYRRFAVDVVTGDGTVTAWIYMSAED